MIDILHITSSLIQGGAEQIALQVIRHYHTQGYRQSVLYYHDGPHRHTLAQMGIPTMPLTAYTLWTFSRQSRLIMSWLWMANLVGRIAARIAKVPHIATFHNMPILEQGYRRTIDQVLAIRPTCAVAVSEPVRQAYQSIYPWNTVSWTVIPNGVPLPAQAAPRWIPGTPLHLLTVGRLVPVKRIDLVLDTLACLHAQGYPVKLTIVGHGPLEAQLRAQAAAQHIDSLITWVINQDALPFYGQTHLYIQLSESESFSLTAAQALAHTQPTIVAGPGGIHPLVTDHVQGRVVPTGHYLPAVAAVQDFWDHPDIYYQYASQGHDLVKHTYSQHQMVAGYQELALHYLSSKN